MRIWIVTNARLPRAAPWRASALQNLQLALALGDLGHDVVFWLAEVEGEAAALVARRLGRPVPAGVRFLRFHPRGPREEKKTPFGAPLSRWWNLRRGRRLGGGAPDAVLTRSPTVLTQLRAAPGFPAAARCVLEMQYPEWALLWRGWRAREPAARLEECVARLRQWRRAESEGLRAADGVLYAARAHEPMLARLGWTGPMRWLPSGAPPPADAPAEEAAEREGTAQEFDVGYAGSLAPENGLETLLDAFARLDGEPRLLLLGGGTKDYVEGLRRRADGLGIAPRVEFGGRVEFHAVRGWMRRCRVGVVPISARCGCEKRQFASPLKLAEWLAAGVPVVAAAVPSVAQHVTDGCQARLVPPDRPEALATALADLLADPALRLALARAGLAHATAHSHAARAEKVAGFVDSLTYCDHGIGMAGV
jgi:glycosyltransferase involved in cell wall biosynthesis